jgi:hypothetical protein
VNCGAIVEETSVINTVDGLFCKDCHQQTPLPQLPLYPYWGISVEEYIRRYMEYIPTNNEINEYVSQLYDRNQ